MAEHGLSSSFLDGFQRAKRPEKLVALALLLLLLTIATASVTGALIGPDWGSLWKSLLIGLLAGWILAIYRQPAFRSVAILLTLGVIYTLLTAGGLSQKLAPLLLEPFRLLVGFITSPRGTSIDLSRLASLSQELFESAVVVLDRVRAWVIALSVGEPTFDPVAAGITWSILVWVVAAWAGWIVEARKNGLLAAIPAILLSVGTLSYARRISSPLYVILGLALVLLATVQHDRLEGEWEATGVAFPARKGQQVGSVAVLITAGLVLFSAFASSLSLQRIEKWLTVSSKPAAPGQGGLAKSLGILPDSTSVPDSFEILRHPGLPRDLLIGSGPQLSKELVMTVVVKDLPSVLPASRPWPLYWRSFTYDIYTGNGWQSTSTDDAFYQADQPIGDETLARHRLVQETIRPVGNGDGVLYTAGEPVVVDQPGIAAWRSSNDLFGFQLPGGGSYHTSSQLPVVSADTLQAAGQRYPDWVRQRYLALPPGIPTRVKELAIQLTSTEPTPYDRARAIERYLRTFPYTVDVTRPPLNRDLVDFFLFDLKKGYCDYYASAMVILARAAGVPARLAIGYASGEYNFNSERFVVTKADAHSWPEVYFPNTGWVPFEPTASRPSTLEEAPLSSTEVPDGFIPTPEAPQPLVLKSSSWKGLVLPGGVVLAILLVAAWVTYDRYHLTHLPASSAAADVYQRMRRFGRRLVVTQGSGDTPFEYTAALSRQLQVLAGGSINSGIGLKTALQVQAMTDWIVSVSYRPVQPESAAGLNFPRQWFGLRWRLGLMLVLKTWKTVRDYFDRTGMEIPGNIPAPDGDTGSAAHQEE